MIFFFLSLRPVLGSLIMKDRDRVTQARRREGEDHMFLVLVLKSLNLEHCDILSYKLYLLLMRQYVPENDLHLQSTAYESSTVDRMMIHWAVREKVERNLVPGEHQL